MDVQGSEIVGWAFDSDAADGRCQIEICVGDRRVVFFSGSHQRDDVARHLDIETASNTGFSIDISSLCQIGSNLISVKFQCDGESLENGEFVTEIVYVPPLDIIAGVDGYWFYTGDKSEVVRHMTGAVTLSSKDIMRIAIRLSGTATVTEAHGGIHIFCVAPDKIVIHPSAFNDTFKVYEDRTSQLFMRKYTEYFGRTTLYPLQELLEDPGPFGAITKTDSHLSWRAQHAVFRTVIEAAGFASALDSIEVEWAPRDYVHDLAIMNRSNVKETEDMPSMPDSALDFFPVPGSDVLICRNKKGSIPLVLLYGTSSCRQLASFVAHIARVTIHIWGNKPDLELIKEIKPTLVIEYAPERSLSVLDGKFSNTGIHIRRRISEVLDLGLDDAQLAIGEEVEYPEDDQSRFEPEAMRRPRRDREKPWPMPK